MLYFVDKGNAVKAWESSLLELWKHREDIQALLSVQECENYGLMGGIAGIALGCVCELERLAELLLVENEKISF